MRPPSLRIAFQRPAVRRSRKVASAMPLDEADRAAVSRRVAEAEARTGAQIVRGGRRPVRHLPRAALEGVRPRGVRWIARGRRAGGRVPPGDPRPTRHPARRARGARGGRRRDAGRRLPPFGLPRVRPMGTGPRARSGNTHRGSSFGTSSSARSGASASSSWRAGSSARWWCSPTRAWRPGPPRRSCRRWSPRCSRPSLRGGPPTRSRRGCTALEALLAARGLAAGHGDEYPRGGG